MRTHRFHETYGNFSPESTSLQGPKGFPAVFTLESFHSIPQHNYTEDQASSTQTLWNTLHLNHRRGGGEGSRAVLTSQTPYLHPVAPTQEGSRPGSSSMLRPRPQRRRAIRQRSKSFLEVLQVSSSDSKANNASLPITHYPSLCEIKNIKGFRAYAH